MLPNPGINSRADAAGADLRALDRPRAERLLRGRSSAGCRTNRPREHDVHRLPAGGHRHLGAAILCKQPAPVRPSVGRRVLCVGRDLLAVPRDVHRYLRQEIRHDQLWSSLHGQRHGIAACAARKCADVATGSWTVFFVAAALNIVAAIMAPTVLRPLRMREMARAN